MSGRSHVCMEPPEAHQTVRKYAVYRYTPTVDNRQMDIMVQHTSTNLLAFCCYKSIRLIDLIN